jgi:DNA-binding NarL/FixJ family response regulator
MRRKLLLIDDDAEYRQGLQRFLGKNYEVLEAANGKAALLLLDKEQVEIVVTDILMPEVDGIETIKAIRQRWPKLMIIAISVVDSNTLQIAQKLGADAVFSKSSPLNRLAEMVDSAARLPATALTGR